VLKIDAETGWFSVNDFLMARFKTLPAQLQTPPSPAFVTLKLRWLFFKGDDILD